MELKRPFDSTLWAKTAPARRPHSAAGEKRQRADQIVGHLDALDRLQAGDGFEFVVHGGKTRARLAHQRARRTGQPRRDRIDGDAVGGDIAGQRPGETDDAALANLSYCTP
jgi:hypothetical protein